jgi:hypothetical protein
MERLLAALQSLALDSEAAAAERVAPLLYFGSPATASPALQKAYYESAARNVLLLDALDELTSAFASRGVRPVLLKGADFATSLYPSAALRPMSDLDLWVAPEDVTLAENALASLGYRPAVPEMTKGLARAIRHAQLYVSGTRGDVAVDLHWSLVGHDTDRRAPSLDWFRSRCVVSRASRLDATASLLYLAGHMKLQHYDERLPLIWLSDFYLLSLRSEVNWQALFEAARSFRWEAALAATAAEVEARLGIGLPPPLAAYAPTVSMAIPDHKGGPERAWNELVALSFGGRAALVKAFFFPCPSYVRFRYRPRPAWTWPLCYPKRWAQILLSAASLAVKPRRSRPLLVPFQLFESQSAPKRSLTFSRSGDVLLEEEQVGTALGETP